MAALSADVLEPQDAARAAGLRYVSDAAPGIRRKRAGRGFAYVGPDGTRISDPDVLAWIKSLAVPPAWTDVWICPDPRGHIQATGRDARGRKQYRYHAVWRQVRDETKYDRMIGFGEALPSIRQRVAADLSQQGLPSEKVLAAVVRLIDGTLVRIGNPEYARENGSYGLTTMRDDHVNVFGSRLRFRFRGKGGKPVVVDISDRRLARVIKRCQDLPGEELFQYVDDDGTPGSIDSGDVNDYLREISGQDFTAKDFRTWGGSVLAARALRDVGSFRSEREAKSKVLEAVKAVARELGNTPTVCRNCYIHPGVIEAYTGRTLEVAWRRAEASQRTGTEGLREEEAVLLLLLRGPQAQVA
jgi:DNA topoisomerase-1